MGFKGPEILALRLVRCWYLFKSWFPVKPKDLKHNMLVYLIISIEAQITPSPFFSFSFFLILAPVGGSNHGGPKINLHPNPAGQPQP